MPQLLIELLSEEIPARMQARAAADLRKLITDGLVEAGLTYASAGAFATPRRLALSVEGLTGESPTSREERKGPRTDAPDQALAGFLRSTGLAKDQLETRDDKKGPVWFAVKVMILVFFMMWTRGTLPRFRFDQLMKFGWKFLLPLALANLMVTALVVALLES